MTFKDCVEDVIKDGVKIGTKIRMTTDSKGRQVYITKEQSQEMLLRQREIYLSGYNLCKCIDVFIHGKDICDNCSGMKFNLKSINF